MPGYQHLNHHFNVSIMKFQELLAKTNLRRGELKPSFNTGETPTQQHFHTLIDGLYLAQDDTLYKDKHSGLGIIAATPIPTDNANFKGNVENTTGDVLLFYDNDNQEPAWAMSILEGFHLKNASDQAQLSILPNGKVGIGTTNPATRLDVKGDLTLGADYQGDGRAGVINFRRGTNNAPTASLGFTGGESEFQFKNHFGGGHYTFYTDVSGTFTEKMRIANDGNVGIGTANPKAKLHVVDSESEFFIGNNNICLKSKNFRGAQITWLNEDNQVMGSMGEEGDSLTLLLNSKYNFTIQGGNVGIGAYASDYYALRIGGDTFVDSLDIENPRNINSDSGGITINSEGIHCYTQLVHESVGQHGLLFNCYSSGDLKYSLMHASDSGRAGSIVFQAHGGYMSFFISNYSTGKDHTVDQVGAAMYLTSDGDGKFKNTVWAREQQLTSDSRLKKNIQLIEVDTITKLTQLNGVTYQWRSDEFKDNDFSKETQIGFIAQEVQEVYPELVSEDNEGYLSINYNGLIPILVEAVKDLNQQNQVLQASVANLEQRVFNTSQA